MVKLSVVIPAYNEQGNLPALIFDTSNALASIDALEIIIVDDASTDNTHSVSRELLKKYPSLTYLRHTHRSGQSTAVCTGVKHAKHSLIATIDGDGQNPPSEILKLLDAHTALQQNPSILFVGHRQHRKDTWIKRLSSRVANKVRRGLLKDDCPDTGCGLKLFSKEAFLALPQFNHMHRFLPALFKRNSMTVVNVPIQHKERLHGVSKYNTLGRLKVGIVDLFGVAWLARRPCNPTLSQEDTTNV